MSLYLRLVRRLDARQFLLQALRRGPVYIEDLETDAAKAGIDRTSLYAAAAGRVRKVKYGRDVAWQLNEQPEVTR